MMRQISKHWLWLIAAASVTLTSCVKEDIAVVPEQPESELVQPENGMNKVDAAEGDPAVLQALQAIPNVTDVKCIRNVFARDQKAYYFNYQQDIDHQNPSLGKFKQQVVMTFVDKDSATVLHTAGYALRDGNRLDSLFAPSIVYELNANCVHVEHRYHGWSLPEGYTNKFNYLNTQQQSDDLHAIVTALKGSNILNGKWLSTGVSKDGMTTAFYAYHYPGDVDGYIPFCAPFLTSLTDQRPGVYLINTPGYESILAKVKTAMRAYFQNEQLQAECVELYRKANPDTEDNDKDINIALKYRFLGNMYPKMSYISLDKWENWIPEPTSDAQTYYRFIMADENTKYPDENDKEVAARRAMINSSWFRNANINGSLLRRAAEAKPQERFDAYYVQTCIDLGTYQLDFSWVEDLITDEERQNFYSYTQPSEYGVVYDNGQFMRTFLDGMRSNDCKVLFVYGSQDPWTGGGISDTNLGPNMQKMIVEKGTHNDYFGDWTEDEQIKLWSFILPIVRQK